MIGALAAIGEVARRRNNLVLAGQLFAVAEANRACLAPLFSERADFDRVLAPLATYLQNPQFASAWQEGATLTVAEAVALAQTAKE